MQLPGQLHQKRRGTIGKSSRIDFMFAGDVRFRRDHFLTSAPVSGVFGELRKISQRR
jgi:hypothetical protein